MEETLDRLLIKLLFVLFTCLLIYGYKYAHYLLYPVGKRQFKKVFDPIINPPNTLHFLSRILGIALIFYSFEFNRYYTLGVSILHLLAMGIGSTIIYLISIYLADSIILYQFNYRDEILKKENYSYALICFMINICIALLIKQIIVHSENSFVLMSMHWLYSLFLWGAFSKAHGWYSRFNFKQQLIQKNLGLAFSFSGFLLGNTIIIILAFDQDHYNFTSYLIRIILKIVLSLLMIPAYVYFLNRVLSIKRKYFSGEPLSEFDQKHSVGIGLVEGIIYLTASFLTAMVAYKINISGIVSSY